MNLAAELNQAVESLPAHQRGGASFHGCSVCRALKSLPEGERMALRNAIASPLGSNRLAKILQTNGVRVGVPSIRLHRQEGHE